MVIIMSYLFNKVDVFSFFSKQYRFSARRFFVYSISVMSFLK